MEMSVRLWAYATWKCNGQACPMDCDRCAKREEQYCEECTHDDDGVRCEECEVFKEDEE